VGGAIHVAALVSKKHLLGQALLRHVVSCKKSYHDEVDNYSAVLHPSVDLVKLLKHFTDYNYFYFIVVLVNMYILLHCCKF